MRGGLWEVRRVDVCLRVGLIERDGHRARSIRDESFL